MEVSLLQRLFSRLHEATLEPPLFDSRHVALRARVLLSLQHRPVLVLLALGLLVCDSSPLVLVLLVLFVFVSPLLLV